MSFYFYTFLGTSCSSIVPKLLAETSITVQLELLVRQSEPVSSHRYDIVGLEQ